MNCNYETPSRNAACCRDRNNFDISGPGPVRSSFFPFSSSCFDGNNQDFPVGMGYVPIQMWETTYPLSKGFIRGTIFPSLDYPFAIGRCRR